MYYSLKEEHLKILKAFSIHQCTKSYFRKRLKQGKLINAGLLSAFAVSQTIISLDKTVVALVITSTDDNGDNSADYTCSSISTSAVVAILLLITNFNKFIS